MIRRRSSQRTSPVGVRRPGSFSFPPFCCARRSPASATSASQCLAPNGYAEDTRAYILEVINGTDSALSELRMNINLPPAPPTEVVFESDSTQCAAAARAHAIATETDTLTPAPVYLLRVGSTRFVVFNGFRVGEFITAFIFDTTFRELSAFGS